MKDILISVLADPALTAIAVLAAALAFVLLLVALVVTLFFLLSGVRSFRAKGRRSSEGTEASVELMTKDDA